MSESAGGVSGAAWVDGKPRGAIARSRGDVRGLGAAQGSAAEASKAQRMSARESRLILPMLRPAERQLRRERFWDPGIALPRCARKLTQDLRSVMYGSIRLRL